MSNRYTDLSRQISHALRHEPWLYELELDEEGWVPVDALLEALARTNKAWPGLAESDLAEMMRLATKQRFELAGGRIRALYGHSLPGRLQKTKADPPSLLYHGTSPALEASIREQGLRPMRRQFVHLSVDRATALEVGRRKAQRPVVLLVRASAASAAGIPFYVGNASVWLAGGVPPAYIGFE